MFLFGLFFKISFDLKVIQFEPRINRLTSVKFCDIQTELAIEYCGVNFSVITCTEKNPSFFICLVLLTDTVKPPLRGHPRDKKKCPVNGGVPLKKKKLYER